MNEQNPNPINGQSESHGQQTLTNEAQRLVGSIEQALEQTDSDGAKWKQQLEKKWGCQVVVDCEQQPFQVTLRVLLHDCPHSAHAKVNLRAGQCPVFAMQRLRDESEQSIACAFGSLRFLPYVVRAELRD